MSDRAFDLWSGYRKTRAGSRELILRGLASGHLRPVIARTFPFSQIVAAHRYLGSNQQVGKIVVTV